MSLYGLKMEPANPPHGLGASVAMVQKLVADDHEAVQLLREGITAPVGRPPTRSEEPVIGDNITNFSSVDQKGDGRGTSKAYTLSRLANKAPEQFEAVKGGKKSANPQNTVLRAAQKLQGAYLIYYRPSRWHPIPPATS